MFNHCRAMMNNIYHMKEVSVGVAGIMCAKDFKLNVHKTTKGVIQIEN